MKYVTFETDWKPRVGLGVQRQDWLQCRHYILRVGHREARAIVPHDSQFSLWPVSLMLCVLIVTGGAQ